MIAAKVDAKGRVAIPKKEREELGIKPGDTVFIAHEGKTLQMVKAENPFDGLAAHAISEYRAGRTRRLQPRSRTKS